MEIKTHQKINQELCGTPLNTKNGSSAVSMQTTRDMAADASQLVHGGFIFGLADYAAMIAVNHPNVVLGGAEVKFLKPVKVGETVVAKATVESEKGKKKSVTVTVSREDEKVLIGTFACFVLDRHVLADA